MIGQWKHFGRLAMATALLVSSLGGCVIATGSNPPAKVAVETGGATFCEQSSDGKSVACGGRATFCQQSSDGRMVACGGLATFCQQSSAGNDVACGGLANHCEKSADGRKVACGGGRAG